MSLDVFLGFLPYFFIVSYTPGPANLYSMDLGMKFGMKTYFKVYAGLFSAYLVIVITAAFLSYQFERYLPALMKALTLFGVFLELL